MTKLECLTLRAFARIHSPALPRLCDDAEQRAEATALVRRIIAARGDYMDCLIESDPCRKRSDVLSLSFALSCMNEEEWLW